MADMKICVWNVEWMNDLFGSNELPPAFRADNDKPAHASGSTVRKRRDDLSGVINELSPDVVVIVEGPNRTGELQLFFDEDVAGDWQCHIQYSKGQAQNLGVAVRIDQGKFDNPPFKAFDTNNMEQYGPGMDASEKRLLYSKNQTRDWITQGKVNERLTDESLIWRKYRHASDHFPLTAVISL